MSALENWTNSRDANSDKFQKVGETESETNPVFDLRQIWTQCPDGTVHLRKATQTRSEICGDQT